jgi:phi LC3 family holin
VIYIKINWKARFKNKTFLVSFCALIISFIYECLSLLGVAPSVSENDVLQIIYIIINILGVMGVIIDPTTKGICDSERALTYYNNEAGDNIG